MADPTDFSSIFGTALDWAQKNPGLTGAAIGGIGTLIDPAQPGGTTTQQNVQLPGYIAPYVGRMLDRAEGLSQEQYIPYGGQRIADFNPDQQQAFDMYRNMSNVTPAQIQGSGIVGEAANRLMQSGGSQIDPMSPYQMQGADLAGQAGSGLLWNAQQSVDPMSPYQIQGADLAGQAGAGLLQNAQERVNPMSPYQQKGAGYADTAAAQMLGLAGQNFNPLSPYQQQGADLATQAGQKMLSAGDQRWDQANAEHYMSPYMQSVVDIQKREAERDYAKQLPGMAADAVKQGAFGGDRQAILQAEAQRNLSQHLGDIQAQGQQAAYANAQSQFNADANRQGNLYSGAAGAGQSLAGIGQQGQSNQLSDYAQKGALLQGASSAGQAMAGIGNQGIQNQLNDLQRQGVAYGNAANAGQTMAGIGNQGVQNQMYDLTRQGTAYGNAANAGQTMAGIGNQGIQNQLYDKSLSQSAYGTSGNLGNTLASIGQQGFQNQLAVNQGIMGIGNQQQALDQSGLNVGYQNFLDQRNQPYQQTQYMQNFLQGLPMTQMNTATVTPPPTMAQQLISSGLGGYMIGSKP